MAGKTRSPNYPAVGLSTAVEWARKLWDREKRTAVDYDTAARDMGYKGVKSGPARVAIGALRQYGLIDKAEHGHLALSELSVRILHGTAEQRQDGLRAAALTPPLFKELHRSHADASDDALRAYLFTKKGFVDEGARNVIKAFRDTFKLANVPASGYNEEKADEQPEDIESMSTGQIDGDDGAMKPPPAKPDGNAGVFSMTVPFSKGSIAVQVRVTGDALRPAHLARVRKYLELAEADWEADGE